MPSFIFRAYDAKGSLVSGTLAADTRDAALDTLARRGVFPLEIGVGEAAQEVTLPWWQREVFTPRGGALSHADLAVFARELATLVKAELPIDEALRIVALQPSVNARTRGVVRNVLTQVMEGKSLSEAMALVRPSFPEHVWRTIAAGEAGSTLAQSLDELARYLERGNEVRSKLATALLYPAILLLAAGAALAVVMGVLLPTIAPLFKDAGKEPPAVLGLLLDAQAFIAAHWPLLLSAALSLMLLAIAAWRNAAARLAIDRATLRLPLARALITARDTARFARTLATLLRSGVPMLDALRSSGEVVGNRAFGEAVRTVASQVREGGTLSDPLARSGRFSELALRLVTAGERTGQLDPMLMRVAEIYEDSLQRQLMRLTSLVTPILTVVIGFVVGALILSVMGAIVGLNELAVR